VKAKALRYNTGKLRWSLVHYRSLEPMVRVLEFGATKYSPDNWKLGMDNAMFYAYHSQPGQPAAPSTSK